MTTTAVNMDEALSIYEKLSQERKELQSKGLMPSWFITGGWQLFKEKYLYNATTPYEQYKRIANHLAQYAPKEYPEWWNILEHGANWAEAFFNIMWNGWLSPSTPVLSNTGTDRGCSVSCSNTYFPDSINGIYTRRAEIANLTKEGFGTSAYLGDIRPRGAKIKTGGTSSGVLPVFKGIIEDMQYVVQASRRGSCAAYIEIDHGDFYELADYIENFPDDANIGWIIKDSFIERLNNNDKEAHKRFKRSLKLKMITGKGYFFFVDRANRLAPEMYKKLDLKIRSSNLCNEIMLFSDKDHSYTCVLSSINVSKYDELKDKKVIFISTVFLDCVAEDFIQKGKTKEGLERAVRFTEKGRALGLGVTGFATYLQTHNMSFEGLEAHMFNIKLFKHMDEESKEASQWLAKVLGEPEWCRGTSLRNTHTMAIAPTKSTALIMGGISEGISPDVAYTYEQLTPVGEINRMNPNVLQIMKDRGVYDEAHITEVVNAQGSLQGVDWLSDEEKLVYRTAFEINQEAILRLASARQKFIDQGQSLNLFFAANEDEGYIAEIHQKAFMDPYIKGLYYCYSKAGVTAAKDECVACQ